MLLLAACGSATAREVQFEEQLAARTALAAVEPALDRLEARGDLLGAATVDSCRTGQHNWKIDDPYDVACSVTAHRAFLVDGADFRQAAQDVHGSLPGCPTGGESDGERVLRDYWDKLRGTTTANFPGPYRPDFLPGYRLGCPPSEGAVEDDPAFRVTGWATAPTDEIGRQQRDAAFGLHCTGGTDDEPCTRTGDALDDVWQRVESRTGWIVFLAGTTEYARTG